MTTDPTLSTTNPLPEPFVPPDVDLRKKDYMPLHGDILLSSAGWNLAPLEARGPMLQLWWHAWSKQLPAGSLPNDEGELIAVAGLQARPELWTKHRQAILRGFVLCSDGRLYHRFLADLIHELLENRRFKSTEIRQYRERKRARLNGVPLLNGLDVGPKSGAVVPRLSARYDTIRDDTITKETSSLVGREDLLAAVDEYNLRAEKYGWPIAQRLSKAREQRLGARLRQHSGEGWKKALDLAEQSGFLTRGDGAREGWVPDLDFFIQEKSFNRLIEGYYGDRKRSGGASSGAGGRSDGVTSAALRGILGTGRSDNRED